MALNRKYAALPDLDSAPDIYETPDLIDDNSTIPTGTIRSQSPSSDYQDFDDSPDISRSRLNTDSARAQFEPTRVDAKDVDFSDRVNGKRKSYKISTRRRRNVGGVDNAEFSDDIDSDDDVEGLERRMARLRREIEEVKGEIARRQEDKKPKGQADEEITSAAETEKLGRMLDGISAGGERTESGSGARLSKALATTLQSSKSKKDDGEAATYNVTYAPDYPQTHDAARAAAFDTRLTQLERSLGITSTAVPALDTKGVPVAILPSIDNLQRQIAILLESTPSSLDNISRRVRSLTQEAERLDEVRRSAVAAKKELREAGADTGKTVETKDVDDEEQASKINALYGTLSTIEGLAPLLPSLLDRLRSLRTIHADAATAHEDIERAMKRQEEMGSELKRWREGLEKVEEAMVKGEGTMGKNVETVQGWVKELEGRMEKLGV